MIEAICCLLASVNFFTAWPGHRLPSVPKVNMIAKAAPGRQFQFNRAWRALDLQLPTTPNGTKPTPIGGLNTFRAPFFSEHDIKTHFYEVL